jgi:hypothetical protein
MPWRMGQSARSSTKAFVVTRRKRRGGNDHIWTPGRDQRSTTAAASESFRLETARVRVPTPWRSISAASAADGAVSPLRRRRAVDDEERVGPVGGEPGRSLAFGILDPVRRDHEGARHGVRRLGGASEPISRATR